MERYYEFIKNQLNKYEQNILVVCKKEEVDLLNNDFQQIGYFGNIIGSNQWAGIAMAIPESYGGFIFARSGLATKKGLAPANKVGVIDSDYRGEIIVALHNHSNEIVTVTVGERIAQIVILPILTPAFNVVDNLDRIERNTGGFGSTGK